MGNEKTDASQFLDPNNDPLEIPPGMQPISENELPREIIFDFSTKHDPPQFLFNYKGVGFFPLGDIQSLKGLEGNGKSFLVSLLISCALGADCGDLSCNIPDNGVLLIDTEQHPRNIALAKGRICRMLGWNEYEVNERFHIITLVDIDDPALAFSYASAAIDKYKPGMVVLDGIADVIDDINDRKEANKVVKSLHIMAKTQNCVLLNVIHVNYGSDKAQGNVGTILRHKVSDELQCSKVKEGGRIYFKVTQTKARNKDISDFEFEIDDSVYRMGIPKITTPEDWDTDTPGHRKTASDYMLECLGKGAMSKSKLIDSLHAKHYAGADKTAATGWFERARRWGIVKENRNHQWEYVGLTESDGDPLGGPTQTELAF